ncbi:DegT/DnrJ/EryC1/StrS aminotransferase family protein [Polynucleobacter sp. MWH-UH25E]|uniref:DegT/DnrJ/EryC1/StrS family aminotransferase n=1 Tax=Polynucleobacter sp. MWH-UH25E TaxID=1855616 RepID=UPI001BFD612C|nr:DegT/DnrJ/EryC1/StrS family aminotransferase [Polynucleobacter sp. MWH-UH25E]QWD62353.1 DegT/DnrJ/EryC1/StrS family aminotransferase [Polynucleobacter sp. MWH-UH25E]
MNNTKHPFGKFNGNEAEYVLRALDTENIENKSFPWVQRFEEAFSEKVGSKYAIAVNSGTSGLHAALFAAGVSIGDEVIQPATTVVMDAYVTLHLGAVPVFVDIDPKTWNIDSKKIEEKITKKTKAIIVVSLYGLPVDIDPIMEIAKKYNLVVIDDSAETLMSRYKGGVAGTHAHFGVYSFEKSKHITSGSEGGMIITSDEKLAVLARKFAGIGYKGLTAKAGRTSLASSVYQDPGYERFDLIGLNYRMNAITAAVGLGQFERVDHLVERRKAIGAMFLDAVSGCEWIETQEVPDHSDHGYFTFGILYLGHDKRGITWKNFYDSYRKAGGHGFYACWKNPYLEPSLRGLEMGGQKFDAGLCPVAEDYQSKIMAFKTNYRNLGEARQQANILSSLIDKIGR